MASLDFIAAEVLLKSSVTIQSQIEIMYTLFNIHPFLYILNHQAMVLIVSQYVEPNISSGSVSLKGFSDRTKIIKGLLIVQTVLQHVSSSVDSSCTSLSSSLGCTPVSVVSDYGRQPLWIKWRGCRNEVFWTSA